MIGRSEPNTLAPTLLLALGTGATAQRRPFNAGLTLGDASDRTIPYLAEAVPQLRSAEWQVFPDGRMQTTHRLRPSLTWHDGAPLTAADFVFAWQIYTHPDYGTANSPPHSYMESVEAPDDRSVVIRWRRAYPGAADLRSLGGAGASPSFAPLPRHHLGVAYEQDPRSLTNLPFWTVDFVGLGPYRVARWEPGTFLEGSAFEGHALGRPRIDRIRFLFYSDPNAALAQLLAGEAHVPVDDSIGLTQGLSLKQEWEPRGAGAVHFVPSIARYIRIQHRPQYAVPGAILDLRVRKALSHTIEKQEINEGLFSGAALQSDTLIPPGAEYPAELTRGMPSYRYDPAAAERLMREAGFVKDSDGFYLERDGSGRLNFEVKNIQNERNDRERTILATTWRRFGFEIEESVYTPAQARDNIALSTFRSMGPTGGVTGEDRFLYFLSAEISSPETRWVGSNRGGWSHPEYDRLVEALNTTLERDARVRLIADAARVINEDVAVIPLYYAPSVLAYPSSLLGIQPRSAIGDVEWNIHEWELRR
jgi:peptide/nickel transport system substrate-binding protein